MFSSKNALRYKQTKKQKILYIWKLKQKKQRKNYKLYIKKVTIGFRKFLELNNNEKIMY